MTLLLLRLLSLSLLLSLLMKSNSKKNMLVVGLNPALQRSIRLSSLVPGSVHRGIDVSVSIGGKGQDVLVAADCQIKNKENLPLLLQFLGSGYEGDALGSLLEAKTGIKLDSSDSFSIRTKARCRTCITLIDMKNEEATEIIEPSESIESSELELLMNKVTQEYSNDKVDGLVIMGSSPPGCPDNLYSQIMSVTCSANTKIVLDTATGINDALAVCKSINNVPIIKVNARELCKLANVQVNVGSESASATEGSKLIEACKILGEKYQTSFYAAVTDGPFGAYLFKNDIKKSLVGWQYTKPKLHKPFINPIGAGDATSSGLSLYICDKIENSSIETDFDKKILKGFQWGLACGSASCLTDKNSVFELDDCKIIFDAIKFEQLI